MLPNGVCNAGTFKDAAGREVVTGVLRTAQRLAVGPSLVLLHTLACSWVLATNDTYNGVVTAHSAGGYSLVRTRCPSLPHAPSCGHRHH